MFTDLTCLICKHKFMQRAAASKINENIPSHVQDVAEDLASSPSPKRRKLGSNPQKSRGIPNPELQQMQSAIYEDEAKKEKALEKLAKDTGETKWVLSQPVFQADESKKGRKNPQYLVIGDGQVEDHDRAYIGRRRFGVLSISHQIKDDQLKDCLLHDVVQVILKKTTAWTSGRVKSPPEQYKNRWLVKKGVKREASKVREFDRQ
ncbi:uncharacterized protein KY384_005306 [Bacidia gigantensis]|uniref:uncharacterized protein n=1 Tax=Bacidia gigantensis TaxID=2732470 RepID=UPI001D04DDD0|nr:uncharacterized protein KY384_005306 [Bacidia gigantensis]KAG8529825.1 hypothetical protein KY384_005306 [Bacidia gigantensis]